jgi:hypothetical protein
MENLLADVNGQAPSVGLERDLRVLSFASQPLPFLEKLPANLRT